MWGLLEKETPGVSRDSWDVQYGNSIGFGVLYRDHLEKRPYHMVQERVARLCPQQLTTFLCYVPNEVFPAKPPPTQETLNTNTKQSELTPKQT